MGRIWEKNKICKIYFKGTLDRKTLLLFESITFNIILIAWNIIFL